MKGASVPRPRSLLLGNSKENCPDCQVYGWCNCCTALNVYTLVVRSPIRIAKGTSLLKFCPHSGSGIKRIFLRIKSSLQIRLAKKYKYQNHQRSPQPSHPGQVVCETNKRSTSPNTSCRIRTPTAYRGIDRELNSALRWRIN